MSGRTVGNFSPSSYLLKKSPHLSLIYVFNHSLVSVFKNLSVLSYFTRWCCAQIQFRTSVRPRIWESSEESISFLTRSCHQIEIGVFELALFFSLPLSVGVLKATYQDRLSIATYFKHYFRRWQKVLYIFSGPRDFATCFAPVSSVTGHT